MPTYLAHFSKIQFDIFKHLKLISTQTKDVYWIKPQEYDFIIFTISLLFRMMLVLWE